MTIGKVLIIIGGLGMLVAYIGSVISINYSIQEAEKCTAAPETGYNADFNDDTGVCTIKN